MTTSRKKYLVCSNYSGRVNTHDAAGAVFYWYRHVGEIEHDATDPVDMHFDSSGAIASAVAAGRVCAPDADLLTWLKCSA